MLRDAAERAADGVGQHDSGADAGADSRPKPCERRVQAVQAVLHEEPEGVGTKVHVEEALRRLRGVRLSPTAAPDLQAVLHEEPGGVGEQMQVDEV